VQTEGISNRQKREDSSFSLPESFIGSLLLTYSPEGNPMNIEIDFTFELTNTRFAP
jgi:hypothetical protein